MFGRIWRFVKRNRGKLVVASVVAGGTFVAVNYLKEKFKEYQEMEAAALCDKARKYHHFDSVQRSCNITVLSMLSDVGLSIQKCFDVEKLLAELEQGTNDKIAKWQQLKIMSISRAVSTMYACCILVTLLRVQFNIIAGYMYPSCVSFDLISMPDTTQDGINTEISSVQTRYLKLIQYFVTEGIPLLCTCVQETVSDLLNSDSLKERITLESLRGKLERVRSGVEGASPIGAATPLARFMMPDKHADAKSGMSTENEELYEKLVKATSDTIKSEYFHGVLQHCLHKGQEQLMEFVAETYASIKSDSSPPGLRVIVSTPVSPSLPFAKLIPVMAGLHSRMCRSEHNTFMPQLMILAPLKDFAARVYEAASYRDTLAT